MPVPSEPSTCAGSISVLYRFHGIAIRPNRHRRVLPPCETYTVLRTHSRVSRFTPALSAAMTFFFSALLTGTGIAVMLEATLLAIVCYCFCRHKRPVTGVDRAHYCVLARETQTEGQAPCVTYYQYNIYSGQGATTPHQTAIIGFVLLCPCRL